MKLLDRIVTSNIHAASFMQLRVEAFFGTGAAENLAFPAAASLACGFICAEKGAEHYMSVAALCVMVSGMDSRRTAERISSEMVLYSLCRSFQSASLSFHKRSGKRRLTIG